MGIESLLENISILVQKNKEIRTLKGDDFNVFHLCKIDHYETYHSKIIAELIKPNGHCIFAKDFFKILIQKINLAIPFENYSVHTEYVLPNGRRIDILIEDGRNAIAIENKIYAKDQEKQLEDYKSFLNHKYQRSELYYLTLYGNLPSEKSCSDPAICKQISYRNEIKLWLDECILTAAEAPFIRETLRQYRNLIQELTGNTMESQIMNKITACIIQNRENYEAAQQIANSWMSAKEELRNKLFDSFFVLLKPKGLYHDKEHGWWVCKISDSNIGIYFDWYQGVFTYGLGYNNNEEWEKRNCQEPLLDGWETNKYWILSHSIEMGENMILDLSFDEQKRENLITVINNAFDELQKISRDNVFLEKLKKVLSC